MRVSGWRQPGSQAYTGRAGPSRVLRSRRCAGRASTAAGLEAHVKMEVDSVEATESLVEVALGGAFLPESAVAAELKKGRLQRLRVRGAVAAAHTTSIRRQDPSRSRAATFPRLARRGLSGGGMKSDGMSLAHQSD
jgi:DNA-binding transcriptional LysR family regulator